MDDEDRGDGFFLYSEVSPPRYLLRGSFVVDKVELCVPADGMHSIDELWKHGTVVDFQNIDQPMAREEKNQWTASVVG